MYSFRLLLQGVCKGGYVRGVCFFFFFWLDPLCASPFGPLCNTSGEAGIRGMPCGFMFCMSHSD